MVVRTGPGSRGRNIHRGNQAVCGKAVAFSDRGVAFRPAAYVGHSCRSQYRGHPPVGVLPVVGPSHDFRTFETEHSIRLQSLALVPGSTDIRGPVQPHGIYDIFLPRVPFPAVSWGTGAAVSVIIAAGAWGFKKLFPDKETRLELFFLSNVITAIVSVIATVNGQTAVAGVESVDYTALAGVLALVAIFALLGWKTGAGGRPFRKIMKIKIKDN